MKKVVLLLLLAASAACGQPQLTGNDFCPHADGATFNVDASLGEWRLRDEIGSSTPSVSFHFSKTTPEEIAKYRRQHANTTTVGAVKIDWSRVPLYCEATYHDDKGKYVLEVLNTDGLVRFVPINETFSESITRPIYFHIQNVRDTLLIHSCGNEVSYVMYKLLQRPTDELCNDFAVNATFDPNISLGQWVAPGENIQFEINAKTPEEIAAYRLELKDTPVANMSINWNRVNLFGNITVISSYGRGITITFLVELIDNKGAGSMIPVGNSLTLALYSPRFVIPRIQFKNEGDKLGMMICPTQLPRYFSRREKLV